MRYEDNDTRANARQTPRSRRPLVTLAIPPKRKRNQKAKNEEASQTIGFERLLAVPKADTKPSKKRKTKEDKSIEIEPFAKTAFSLVFFKVYYFC